MENDSGPAHGRRENGNPGSVPSNTTLPRVQFPAWAACVAAAAFLSGCGSDGTRSVHLPLAVGNLWVYDVEADSARDTATLEVIGEDDGVFTMAARCTVGHWTKRKGPLYLTCRDSILWLRDTIYGFWSNKVVWNGILSDDPKQEHTQTLLVFRGPGRSQFTTRSIPEFTVGRDTYWDCLALHDRYTYSWFFWFLFFSWGDDSVEVEEVYCPEVGLVSFSKEHHWRESWGFEETGGSDSGVWHDRWQLRSYSLHGQ